MQDNSGLYPACAVTCVMAKKHLTNSHSIHLNDNAKSDKQSQSNASPTGNGDLDLLGTFVAHLDEPKEDITMERTQESVNQRGCGSTSRTEQLIQAQETDPELMPLFLNALDTAEANKVATCFYKCQGVLMREWRPPTAPSGRLATRLLCLSVFAMMCLIWLIIHP